MHGIEFGRERRQVLRGKESGTHMMHCRPTPVECLGKPTKGAAEVSCIKGKDGNDAKGQSPAVNSERLRWWLCAGCSVAGSRR